MDHRLRVGLARRLPKITRVGWSRFRATRFRTGILACSIIFYIMLQASGPSCRRVSSHASVMEMDVGSSPTQAQAMGATKITAPPKMATSLPQPGPTESRALQEATNALTMVPHTCVLLMRSSPAPLILRLAVVMHTCASISFHLVLVALERQSLQSISSRPWLAKAAMDVDMFFMFVCGIICTAMNATSAASGSIGVLLCLYAMYRVATSPRGATKAEVDAELVGVRYPLVLVTILYESLLVWLCRGDAANAAGIAASICLIGGFSLADKALRGWGHPIGHLMCLPGIWFRSEALVRAGW